MYEEQSTPCVPKFVSWHERSEYHAESKLENIRKYREYYTTEAYRACANLPAYEEQSMPCVPKFVPWHERSEYHIISKFENMRKGRDYHTTLLAFAIFFLIAEINLQ